MTDLEWMVRNNLKCEPSTCITDLFKQNGK